MRPGTPGFSGARLREAREARGLSVVSLADIAGVSSQAIYQYEKKGGSSPGPEVLSKIAAGTNLPEAFFLQPGRSQPETTVFYRSLSSATKAARRRADSRLRWVQDLVAYVEEYVALPEINVPTFELPDDPRLISDADVEHVADELRRYWRLGEGPIANMVLLLENQGIVVARGPLGAEALDGVSTHDGGRPFIFIGTDKEHLSVGASTLRTNSATYYSTATSPKSIFSIPSCTSESNSKLTGSLRRSCCHWRRSAKTYSPRTSTSCVR